MCLVQRAVSITLYGNGTAKQVIVSTSSVFDLLVQLSILVRKEILKK